MFRKVLFFAKYSTRNSEWDFKCVKTSQKTVIKTSHQSLQNKGHFSKDVNMVKWQTVVLLLFICFGTSWFKCFFVWRALKQQEKHLFMCLCTHPADIRSDMYTNGNALKGLSKKHRQTLMGTRLWTILSTSPKTGGLFISPNHQPSRISHPSG